MCGPLDYDKGICLIQGVDKYESLYGTNLKEEFRSRLDLPGTFTIDFEIDTWDFARGEAWRGNAQGFQHVLALTLGTGLGSAFIANGELLADGPGVPPPYGWIGGLPYRDGKMDDTFSRRGILALYHSLSQESPKRSFDVRDIAHKAKKGNSTCIHVFRKFGRLLGEALAPILKEFQAECLVLGGQISKSFDLFETSLQNSLTQLHHLKRITVARSIHLAAIWGAAHRILRKN
jgi:glucokinase